MNGLGVCTLLGVVSLYSQLDEGVNHASPHQLMLLFFW